ncbi:MAG TPA: hypothetical protein VLC29_05095 [Rhizomicrobium sp.]|jgi:hypothetical protein|nr:hypothetical protein [Rhizomicrobium sp.]
MKTRNIIMGGVAALALAGSFAAPGFAQYSGNPPQVSTPEEKAQTEQLNAQAQGGTTASPSALNGQGGSTTEPSPENQARQEQYEDQQAQYQQDRARYEAERRHYERNIHRYDEARYYFTDYPHAYPYHYEDAQLRPLYLLAEPSQQLAHAPVEGPDGNWVGRVRNVETALDGRPKRVEIALNHRVSVWVSPTHFRFDAANKILYTDLTRADLWNMPGATYS